MSATGFALSGGANKKWDMSRRIKRTMTVNAPNLTLPSADKNIAFPTNKLVGNDDPNVLSENNDPYGEAGGFLESGDTPRRDFSFMGDAGSTYQNDTDFEEFVRLEINGKWYLVSDPDPWSVTWKFKKISTTEADFANVDFNKDGDTEDPVNESFYTVDFSGDGDTDDDITRWSDDGSVTENTENE